MKRVVAIFILLALASSASAIEIYTATETVAPVYLNTVDTFGVSITPDSFQVMVRFQTDSATASGYRASGIRPDWILREQGFGNPADGDSTFWFFDTAGNIDGGHGDGFYSGVVLAWAQGTSFPTTFRFGLSGNNTNTVYDLVAGDSSGAARHRTLLALPNAAAAAVNGLPLVDPTSTDGHIYILAPSGVGLPVCYLGATGVSSISSTSFATGAITASALATDAAQEIAHYTADSSWLDPVRPRAITELDEDNTTIDLNATAVGSVAAGVNLKGDSLHTVVVAAESTMTAITATNKANFKADVSGLSTFDNTTDQVIVGTNNDKTGYTLTAAERGSIEDSIHANAGDYKATGFATAGDAMTLTPGERGAIEDSVHANAADYKATGFAVAGDAMALTPAERGHVEDSIHANAADYKSDVSGLSTFDPTTDSVIIDRSAAEAWLLVLMRTVDGDSNAAFRVRVIDSLNVILDSLFNQVWASVANVAGLGICATGNGIKAVTVYVVDTSGTDDSLSSVPVYIIDASYSVQASGVTTSPGQVTLWVDSSASYTVLPRTNAYHFDPYSLTTTAGTTPDTITIQGYDISTTATPASHMTTLYGQCLFQSDTLAYAVVRINLVGANAMYTSVAAYATGEMVVQADANGNWSATILGTDSLSSYLPQGSQTPSYCVRYFHPKIQPGGIFEACGLSIPANGSTTNIRDILDQ